MFTPLSRLWTNIRRHPGWSTLALILAFLLWGFPIGLLQAWPSLVRDKTLREWLTERGWPDATLLALIWLTLAFSLTLVFVVVILVLSYRTSDNALQQIRPLFDQLSSKEKAVLRLMMVTGQSLGTFNVGQLTALENIQRKTGFVIRTFVGPYELNQQIRESLAALFRLDDKIKQSAHRVS